MRGSRESTGHNHHARKPGISKPGNKPANRLRNLSGRSQEIAMIGLGRTENTNVWPVGAVPVTTNSPPPRALISANARKTASYCVQRERRSPSRTALPSASCCDSASARMLDDLLSVSSTGSIRLIPRPGLFAVIALPRQRSSHHFPVTCSRVGTGSK
jgi:hypothetical protein